MMILHLGSFVEDSSSLGIGRVADIDGDQAKIEYFESVAEPVVHCGWLPIQACRPVRLQTQTRVFRFDSATEDWTPGRIIGGSPPTYFVRFPNTDLDLPVQEAELRVRWDRPIRNPVDVLASTANETPVFRDARTPLLQNLVQQRAACAGLTALLSSAVEIYPHQVHTALTVLQDPIQRYLLADEVGLGKTVEAGLIIRQTMLDHPTARIVVIAPDVLRRQWQRELTQKFFVDDFDQVSLRIGAHETPGKWSDYHGFDLVVVDEAHQLVQGEDPELSPYQEMAALARSTERILLLSATPATARPDTHLGLLHLLDPNLYRWNDREAFAQRLATRQRLAEAVYALDGDLPFLLSPTLEQIADLLPADPLLAEWAEQILNLLTEDGELADERRRPALDRAIDALRAHVGETYRLHRRMIRHRRSSALTDNDDALPYEIRGRTSPRRPVAIRSAEHDAAQDALLDWQGRIADWLLDEDRTAEWAAYGRVLAVLASRAGGPVDDLAAALAWRIRGDAAAAERAGLTADERARLRDAPTAPVEPDVLDTLEQARAGTITNLAVALAGGLGRADHAIVFCGPGSLAGQLADELPRHLPPTSPVHRHTAEIGGQAAELAVSAWTSGRGVLVVDATGEDGLNLQIADVVVHCRLPWSPNVLEQRLGRVDRYVRPGDETMPARQYLLAQLDGEFSICGAWANLLDEGYRIFDQSLSTLQDAVEVGLDQVWATALERGPSGLTGQAEAVAAELTTERRAVDAADLIESVFGTAGEADALTASMTAFEADWTTVEQAVTGYAETGLRLRRTELAGPRVVRFDLAGAHAPLLPPRLLARGERLAADGRREGAFNRSVALRRPGTRVFRLGHPFVELLENVMAVDDRGQAAAFWRLDRNHDGDPAVYFGFDVLVEASLRSAADLVDAAHPWRRKALRRQADRLFPPLVARAWVPAGTGAAVPDPRQVAWLDRPYHRECGDVNLNSNRITNLIDLFGTRGYFAQSAHAAAAVALGDLQQVTDLAERSAAAAERARGELAVLRAQAMARRAAGDLVGDADTFALDVDLTEAFIADLGEPTVRVVGVTCLVRSGASEMPRADG